MWPCGSLNTTVSVPHIQSRCRRWSACCTSRTAHSSRSAVCRAAAAGSSTSAGCTASSWTAQLSAAPPRGSAPLRSFPGPPRRRGCARRGSRARRGWPSRAASHGHELRRTGCYLVLHPLVMCVMNGKPERRPIEADSPMSISTSCRSQSLGLASNSVEHRERPALADELPQAALPLRLVDQRRQPPRTAARPARQVAASAYVSVEWPPSWPMIAPSSSLPSASNSDGPDENHAAGRSVTSSTAAT